MEVRGGNPVEHLRVCARRGRARLNCYSLSFRDLEGAGGNLAGGYTEKGLNGGDVWGGCGQIVIQPAKGRKKEMGVILLTHIADKIALEGLKKGPPCKETAWGPGTTH